MKRESKPVGLPERQQLEHDAELLEKKPDPARFEPVRDHVTTGYELGIPTRWIEITHADGTKVCVRYER